MTDTVYLFFTVAFVCVSGIVALGMWIDYKLDLLDDHRAPGTTYPDRCSPPDWTES